MSPKEADITLTTPMLRALANPLRRRIFDTLTALGSARAADLAQALDVAANKVSFHLRELAKAGMIGEAPELARDKRDRVWRPTGEGFTTGEPTARSDQGPASAMNAYLNQVAHDEKRRLEAALRHAQRLYGPDAGKPAKAQLSNSNLMLTEDEAHELLRRLGEVIPAFREDLDKGRIPSAQPAGERELWHYFGLLSAESLLNESHEEADSTQNPT
ncbi:helix-turn-helix domain-containing protein [Glutamicibacter sp. MNS18]|uniref:ArsR/SmtB family transcription factor n=1 Tax=Glutamicibacter sp. MNS18 TaxID=2989817 RepID=UPI002236919F|nr:helix-turn-helix domain-containing protein [Glutamicibacter sp. MNS18]MCW4464749.1 helix-turn-helix domain-containing protein [Glutamicibacter sp. MNS18]